MRYNVHYDSRQERLYSITNEFRPQCSDLTEEHSRLLGRMKFTTIKTNEPEFLYHGDGETLITAEPEKGKHRGANPWGAEHTCEECAPLPEGHPFRKGYKPPKPPKVKRAKPGRPKGSRDDKPRQRHTRKPLGRPPRMTTRVDWRKLRDEDGRIVLNPT
jgi:hypothetical protein